PVAARQRPRRHVHCRRHAAHARRQHRQLVHRLLCLQLPHPQVPQHLVAALRLFALRRPGLGAGNLGHRAVWPVCQGQDAPVVGRRSQPLQAGPDRRLPGPGSRV
ncbi:hypothetical protein H4R21_001342, partial [Coemansia helicoidea]